MLRLRPFRMPDAKTIINWTSEPEEFYKWSAGIFPLVAFDENDLVHYYMKLRSLTIKEIVR